MSRSQEQGSPSEAFSAIPPPLTEEPNLYAQQQQGEESGDISVQEVSLPCHVPGIDDCISEAINPLDDGLIPISPSSDSDTDVCDQEMDIDHDTVMGDEDDDADDHDEEVDSESSDVGEDNGDNNDASETSGNDDNDDDENPELDFTFLYDGTDWRTLDRGHLAYAGFGMHDEERYEALPERFASTVRGFKTVRIAVRDFIHQYSTEHGREPSPVEQDDVILLHLILYSGQHEPRCYEIYPEQITPFISVDDYWERFLESSEILVKVIDENADVTTHLHLDEKTHARWVKLSAGTWFQLPSYIHEYWGILESVGQNNCEYPRRW
ncbi:hypothetical protein, variant 2 [Exophiala oligosperma]|uniref:Uncharacterized protein n=1 Tax=Exophiala oligosperma TaxID=215243 RepID=A0A0D2E7F9_9EURO|nr:uncharacterized protein PV06_04828 [Exophiala oligosperma]XP_016263975.1 hypothetical protein, variant 1 [Exophiala oligosperma]XP_016263976.1 hypothetical protein, variant 2 [Exophiala oligosperma]KIW43758.1 hypothetical protein PV06_04828 [Exophiala oligosperma]KIW43759.1 hypothetical protein, variant 1 [Exophiala oligosperma]KIW43760.1 hypothetical protein, variant 2 [Exophiala oligosperma]